MLIYSHQRNRRAKDERIPAVRGNHHCQRRKGKSRYRVFPCQGKRRSCRKAPCHGWRGNTGRHQQMLPGLGVA